MPSFDELKVRVSSFDELLATLIEPAITPEAHATAVADSAVVAPSVMVHGPTLLRVVATPNFAVEVRPIANAKAELVPEPELV